MTTAGDRQWRVLCAKAYSSLGYSALSDDERVWFNIRALIDSTNNGGLISFFYNSYADTLQDCLRALDKLGADAVRSQVERVCKLFGSQVPLTVSARNEVINSWPDTNPQLSALLNEVDAKLYGYFPDLEASLDAFLRSAAIAS